MYMNDLWGLDTIQLAWIDLNGKVSGDIPPPRYASCLALAGDSFYVFGGLGSNGDLHFSILL